MSAAADSSVVFSGVESIAAAFREILGFPPRHDYFFISHHARFTRGKGDFRFLPEIGGKM
jgi:hypothetical protein